MPIDDRNPFDGQKLHQWTNVLNFMNAGFATLPKAITQKALFAFLYVSPRSCTGVFLLSLLNWLIEF
jgi:hypothetical protein